MTVAVKLYGPLRDLISAEKKGRTSLPIEQAPTVAHLLSSLGIDRPVLVAVNNIHEATLDHALKEGDKVIVFDMTAGG